MFKSFLFRKYVWDHATFSRLSQDCLIFGNFRWPICRFNPITSHPVHSWSYEGKGVFLPPNFWWNGDWSVGSSPMRFTRRDASTNRYVTWLICSMALTWGQILNLTYKFNMQVFWRVLMRGTQWPPNYFNRFLSSKVICKKKTFVKHGHFDLNWSL